MTFLLLVMKILFYILAFDDILTYVKNSVLLICHALCQTSDGVVMISAFSLLVI